MENAGTLSYKTVLRVANMFNNDGDDEEKMVMMIHPGTFRIQVGDLNYSFVSLTCK